MVMINSGYNGIPFDSDYINLYNGMQNPSTLHAKDNDLTRFFEHYLLQEVFSVFEFTLPETWDETYFRYVLFCLGFISVIETDKYGVICQHCEPFGRGIFYQPTNVIISNPLLKGNLKPRIDSECSVIKLQPSWRGIYDLVSFYSTMMAITAESAGINLFNSRLAYVLVAENAAQAESLKKLYDDLFSGAPATAVDKKLFDDEGKPRWMPFNQNLKQTYIASDIMADLHRWKNLFLTEIGIPNANFQKSERMITNEVNANNTETQAKAALWLETMQEGIERTNEMFGTDISVKLRYTGEENNGTGKTDINSAL